MKFGIASAYAVTGGARKRQRPTLFDGKIEREIWRPSDRNGDPDPELIKKSLSRKYGHPTWKIFNGEVSEVIRGKKEPPRHVYLDDKAAYDILNSEIYSADDRVAFWPFDFSGKGGFVKTGRVHRGRPAFLPDGKTIACKKKGAGWYFFEGASPNTSSPAATPSVFSEPAGTRISLIDRPHTVMAGTFPDINDQMYMLPEIPISNSGQETMLNGPAAAHSGSGAPNALQNSEIPHGSYQHQRDNSHDDAPKTLGMTFAKQDPSYESDGSPSKRIRTTQAPDNLTSQSEGTGETIVQTTEILDPESPEYQIHKLTSELVKYRTGAMHLRDEVQRARHEVSLKELEIGRYRIHLGKVNRDHLAAESLADTLRSQLDNLAHELGSKNQALQKLSREHGWLRESSVAPRTNSHYASTRINDPMCANDAFKALQSDRDRLKKERDTYRGMVVDLLRTTKDQQVNFQQLAGILSEEALRMSEESYKSGQELVTMGQECAQKTFKRQRTTAITMEMEGEYRHVWEETLILTGS